MFTPHNKHDVEVMLNDRVEKIEDLFDEILLNFVPRIEAWRPVSPRWRAADELENIASAMAPTKNLLSFLGAGAMTLHSRAVDNLLQRGEFYTAYTPYQPEISQGTLQAIFEFQSLICKLTGMDVSNASHYDGATAAAEAAILAYGHFRNKRKKILVSRAVHPQYRQTIRTYMQAETTLQIVGDDQQTGIDPDMKKFIAQIDNDTALVIVQYPDFFGRIIDYTQLIETAHQFGALVAMAVNPTALALLTPPGELGADISFGEGQPLGIPLSYGGPYLGFFAVKNALLRKLAGRLVGETVDTEGKLAYVLTLTAREQHIRREKASSNICSNQGLMTLAATIYLSLLGKHGLRQVANLCYQKAHYAADQLSGIGGFNLVDEKTPFFHEFVVKCDQPVNQVLDHLLQHDIFGGYDLGYDYPELENHLMLAVTEKIQREDIEYLSNGLQEVNHG